MRDRDAFRPPISLVPRPIVGRIILCLVMALVCAVGCVKKPPSQATIGVGPVRDTDAAEIVDGSIDDLDAGSILKPSILLPAEQEVLLPFGGRGELLLESSAALGRLDVMVSMDTTSSMSEEIALLQEGLLTYVVPALRVRVPDVAIGVSRFEDFPVEPFGSPSSMATRADEPFLLLSAITQDQAAVGRALSSLDNPLGLGGDSPEAGAEALYQIATGSGYRAHGREYIMPFAPEASALGTLGGVGFRDLSLPLVVHITDSGSHEPSDYGDIFPNVHSLDQAIDALVSLNSRVVGVATSSAALDELTYLATSTQAVLPADSTGWCATGTDGKQRRATSGQCPLVFETDSEGSGLSDGIVDSIVALLDGMRFAEVRAVVAADPIGFIEGVSLRTLEQPASIPAPQKADLRPLAARDGIDDTFVDVYNGARMGFLIEFKNNVVEPLAWEQSFRVMVQILGDGLILEEHLLRVVVPAGSSDAGAALDGSIGASDFDASL